MMKYILPIVNCVIICTLSVMLNFRDDTPVIGVILAVIILIVTIYHISLIRKNGNEIKIKAINKIMTLGSAVLIAGCLYEIITGNIISDQAGDIMSILLVAAGAGIWLYDYCIKPFKDNKG